jgi:hypothetical protein
VQFNRELLPREKSIKEEMLLAPENGVSDDIDLKIREKRGERTQVLTSPDLLDSSLS